METYRQQKERLNKLLESIPHETMEDRTKVYSWSSLKENKIQDYDRLRDKGYSVKWCNNCYGFVCHFVIKCCTCKSKESGLGNPAIHAKTIKNQMDNGTFNMLQEYIQKNKISNTNIKYSHKTLFCKNCNEETNHRIWINGSIRCCKCDFKENGQKFKFCNKCKMETIHNGSICIICNPDAISATNNLFVYGNCSCCKHEECNLKFLDRSINLYVCWECYKEQFIINYKVNHFMGKLKQSYGNAFLQSTFRMQESENWYGARSAFDQDLMDKDISWFAYIKFYISKNEALKPLVVGKTGSYMVNINGTDISFSMDESDGPARKFLRETNQIWDKTQIAIIPCNGEQEALEVEKNIFDTFGLFQS